MDEPNRKTHGALAPFVAALHFVENMLAPAGHLLVALLGALLAVTGLLLTVTVYAAPLGVVLLLLGVLLVARHAYGALPHRVED